MSNKKLNLFWNKMLQWSKLEVICNLITIIVFKALVFVATSYYVDQSHRSVIEFFRIQIAQGSFQSRFEVLFSLHISPFATGRSRI